MDSKTLIALVIFCALLVGVGVVCYSLGKSKREVVEREVRVELPGDTVQMPGQLRYIPVTRIDSTDVERWKREADTFRQAAIEALARISIYETMASRLDTTITREVQVYRGDSLVTRAEYLDPLSVEYFYLPLDRFRLTAPKRSFEVRLPVVEVDRTERSFWDRFGYGIHAGVGFAGVVDRAGWHTGPGLYFGFGVTYDFSSH